jgi:hypothetical protein
VPTLLLILEADQVHGEGSTFFVEIMIGVEKTDLPPQVTSPLR